MLGDFPQEKRNLLSHFFLYLDLTKIRLEVMLSDFAEKKETFVAHAFSKKIPILHLFRFCQNKSRNNA